MPMSRLLDGTSVMSRPSRSTRPASGRSKPAIARSAVVFPQPDGPRSARNCPAAMAGPRGNPPAGDDKAGRAGGEHRAVAAGQPLQPDRPPGPVAQVGGGGGPEG